MTNRDTIILLCSTLCVGENHLPFTNIQISKVIKKIMEKGYEIKDIVSMNKEKLEEVFFDSKFIGEKGELSAVSYNTLFFESANEGMVSNYFLKFRASLIDSTDRNAVFISEVASTTEDIVNRVKAVQMGF